jgi:hypothetical protein
MVGKSEWERPLGRTRHRWEDNIKLYLIVGEMGFEVVGWIQQAQDSHRRRVVNRVG